MKDIASLQFLLFLDVEHAIMQARLLERGKTSGRSDDNMDSIVKRLKTYEEQTRPIINHFSTLNMVRRVNSDQLPDAVFSDVAVHFANAE